MSAPPPTQPSPEKPAVILNVNDSASNRYFVSRVLRSAGWTVFEAESGSEALDLARAHHPDVVVLDIKLPDMSGLEVCRHLKRDPETSDILVIQTSATFVTSEGKARGLESGADQYLTQPFEAIELVAMVRGLLRMHEKEVEAREKASALTEADRRKDEFLAMLAHELRNPLSAIMTATTLLEDLDNLPPMGTRLSATIGRQTRHLARLVDDLLDVARITRGKIQLQLEPIDLGSLLRKYLDGASEVTKNHRITTFIADDPMWVNGDTTRLEQIFANLVGNAVKYSKSGGGINISLTPSMRGSQRVVSLKVRDTGVGIARENLTSIFDLFYQVDSTLARSQSGLGVGLTMVKRLVEMHDGTVIASSDGVGHGTEFRLELPAIEALSAAAAHPSSHREAVLDVLLVDDNEDSRELVGMYFEKEGHRVQGADNGDDGLALALDKDFDVAIVDIGLPGLDGYEVARRTKHGRKAAGKRVPLLLALTGYGRIEDKQRAFDAGFDAHLVKPIDVRDMHRVVAKLLSERSKEQQPTQSTTVPSKDPESPRRSA